MNHARRSLLAMALLPILGCAHAQTTEANFLDSLVAETTAAPSDADFAQAVHGIGIEVRTLRAVVEVESSSQGAFTADGKPIVLFEPHIFSRRTNRSFDTSHPTLSHPTWDRSLYPSTQEGRWNQLREAYALAPDAALASTSWGIFQQMGFHFQASGYPDVHSFVRDISRSQTVQLRAWVNWIRSQNLVDELQSRNWVAFARSYNGPSEIERYAAQLAEAYDQLGTQR